MKIGTHIMVIWPQRVLLHRIQLQYPRIKDNNII